MRVQMFLKGGVAMPAIYGLTLAVSWLLNPGIDLLRREPSELGRADAVWPLVYDSGMAATGTAGVLAAIPFMVAAKSRHGSAWTFCAGLTILLSSAGLVMAGLFPLPSTLHYGFGLTTTAVLTPGFGSVLLLKLDQRVPAAILLAILALVAGLLAGRAPPVLPGALMLAAVAFLCWALRHGDQAVTLQVRSAKRRRSASDIVRPAAVDRTPPLP